MATFGERLRRLRQEAGLSQTELAGDGISPSYISLLESGKRSPSGEVVAQLAARLGCSTTLLLSGEPSDRERRIDLELAYARLALEHGQPGDGRTRMDALLAEDGVPQSARDEARYLLASAYEKIGDLPKAAETILPLYERATRGLTEVPLPDVAVLLCGIYWQAGDLQRMSRTAEEALAVAEEQGLADTDEYYRLAATLMFAHMELGDYLHAVTWAKQVLDRAKDSGNRKGQAVLYWNAAVVAEHHGRIDEALQLCQRAMAHLGEQGGSRDLARLRVAAAQILLSADPPLVPEAVTVLEQGRELLEDLGGSVDLVEWHHVRALAALLEHDLDAAAHYAATAVTLTEKERGATDALTAGRAHLALGDALLAERRDGEAQEQREQARHRLGDAPLNRPAALVWRELAERLVHQGELEAAVAAYRRALDSLAVLDRSGPVLAAVEAVRAAGARAEV